MFLICFCAFSGSQKASDAEQQASRIDIRDRPQVFRHHLRRGADFFQIVHRARPVDHGSEGHARQDVALELDPERLEEQELFAINHDSASPVNLQAAARIPGSERRSVIPFAMSLAASCRAEGFN